MKTIKAKTIALVIAMSASTSVYAFPGYQWEKAAQSVGIDPVMLYAVALAESASHRGLNMTSPWPYAIRNGSNATYAKSKTEAEKLLNQALQETEKISARYWPYANQFALAWASGELSSRTARPHHKPYGRLQYFGRSNQVFTK